MSNWNSLLALTQKKIQRTDQRCVTWKLKLRKYCINFTKNKKTNYQENALLLIKNKQFKKTMWKNGEDVLMLLATGSGKSWIYQVLPFIARGTSLIGNKIPYRELYWSAIHEFYSE